MGPLYTHGPRCGAPAAPPSRGAWYEENKTLKLDGWVLFCIEMDYSFR